MKEKTKEESIQEIKDLIFQYDQRIEKDTELRRLHIELLKVLEKEHKGLNVIAKLAVLAALQNQILITASKPIMKRFKSGGTIGGIVDKNTNEVIIITPDEMIITPK